MYFFFSWKLNDQNNDAALKEKLVYNIITILNEEKYIRKRREIKCSPNGHEKSTLH